MGRLIAVGAIIVAVFAGSYSILKHRQDQTMIHSLQILESQNGWRILLHDGRISYLNLADGSVQLVNTQPSVATAAPQLIGAAAVSPDGHQIAFPESLDGKAYFLVFLDLTARKRLELLQSPFLDNPRWSPKGDMVAFSGRQMGNNSSSNLYLYVIRDRGTLLVVENDVATGYPLCWTAESDQIIYQGLDNDIKLIDLKTLQSRVVDKGHFASCSPDGQYVSYQTNENSYALRDLKSNQKTMILVNESVDRTLIWSPDSRYIVYSKLGRGWWNRLTGALSATDSYNELYVMDVKSRAEVKVYCHSGSIYPSDWGRIVFESR